MKCKSVVFACLLAFVLNTYNSDAQTNKVLPVHDSQNIFKQTDTILKWRNDRQFAYMNYLDSLLRKQKYLHSDTASFDENTGRITRKRSLKNQSSAANKVLNSLPVKIFFWILSVVFIVFIGYKVLFQNAVFSFMKKKIVPADAEEEKWLLRDLNEYDSLIDHAEKNNEFNSATRYLFLKTLKNLYDKGFIEFAPEKTNSDYLKEMNVNKYFNDFEKLTKQYEYAWYGKFFIDKKKYTAIKESYHFFNEKV